MSELHHRHHRRRGNHLHGHHPRGLPPAPAHPRVAASTPPPGEFSLWWEHLASEMKEAYLAHAGRATELLRRWFDHHAPSPGTAYGVPPTAARASGHRRGDPSMRYETGCVPGQEAKAAATVSGGVNDPGGRSYGAYQMTSTATSGAVVLEFLKHEGASWAKGFTGLDPTMAGAFETEWKRIAAAQPDAFFTAQHRFIERTHFNRVVARVQKDSKVDLTQAGDAVGDVIWSMSVQHGRAAQIIDSALGRVAGKGHPGERDYDRDLINAMYDEREAYVTRNHQAYLIKQRFVPERTAALHMVAGGGDRGRP